VGKFGTYSKKTPEVYEYGCSMPSSTKTMNWTFSTVSQQEADLAQPSLASVWQNLFSRVGGQSQFVEFKSSTTLDRELRAKFPLLQFPQITSIDDLNCIGAFLYVDDMVLIARSPAQLQSVIDA